MNSKKGFSQILSSVFLIALAIAAVILVATIALNIQDVNLEGRTSSLIDLILGKTSYAGGGTNCQQNGIIDTSGEECDCGIDKLCGNTDDQYPPAGLTCASKGFASGTLKCLSDCTVNTSSCVPGVNEYTTVTMSVTTSNCNGNDLIEYKVYEDDIGAEIEEDLVWSGQVPCNVNPVIATWQSISRIDDGAGDPEYYFVATLVSDPTKTITSSNSKLIAVREATVSPENCADSIDNDGDTEVDCADTTDCPERSVCGTGKRCINNDCVVAEEYRVFVTKETFPGNFGAGYSRVEGGDKKCQEAANTAGLSGTWRAWLSSREYSPSGDYITPIYRLYHSDKPYVLLDGTIVANNWADLIKGSLRHYIDVNEYGDKVTSSPFFAWTATQNDGTGLTKNCNYWSSSSSDWSANVGTFVLHPCEDCPGSWSDSGSTPCNENNRLYCFEQPLCNEVDGGVNAYMQGNTCEGEVCYSDACVNSNMLQEYFCEDGKVDFAYMGCGKGCNSVFGKCLE
jgi:hypothetical protein